MPGPVSKNPTESVPLNFAAYVAAREQERGAHLINGVPDYGFSLDYQIRSRLASLEPARALADTMSAALIPQQRQLEAMRGVMVGPNQLPEIHAIAEDCARRLGIAVPRVFVYADGELNAFTIATTDVAPIVVITNLLLDALEPEELRFVIGHECGHVHNLHGTYQMIAEMIANPLANTVFSSLALAGPPGWLLAGAATVLQQGLTLFFRNWGRCAETTADRAGLICCGDLRVGQSALAKLATGGVSRMSGLNLDEFMKQSRTIAASPGRLSELFYDHPLVPRRLAALALFAQCEVLASWRPDMPHPQKLRSKAEIDQLCGEVLGVLRASTVQIDVQGSVEIKA